MLCEKKKFLGWMVGFEPTNTGATTQGLNHLTTPTMLYKKVATGNGLEPSTSSVTGWHSNQLNYPAAYGGRNRTRTYDPLLVRQVLSQLSYDSMLVAATGLEPVTFRV